MAFNSAAFLIFFVAFFLLYWFVFNKKLAAQNLFILISSYLFYAWWDWRFLFLLAGISVISYFLGISIDKTEDEKKRRLLVYVGVAAALSNLFFFKYFNFFIDSFQSAFALFNINLHTRTLNLILPLGISFYSFRVISYLLDVDSGKIRPATNPVVFCNYVSFFPTLLAGPIDRAKTFIPQLEKQRVFTYSDAAEGMRQILWGLFKKVAIADSCAAVTDSLFIPNQTGQGSMVLLGAFIYIIQVYADFSGYSDMAIGISRLMGFTVTKNFNYPFFAQNIAEFWQKWHISLTTWMTEYVFTPLSYTFRKLRKTGIIIAIILNFILVGLWHGANWTFIMFGFLQGCYFIPLIIKGTLNKKRTIASGRLLPGFKESINIAGTFTLVMLTGILFRANSLHEAVGYYKRIFSASLLSVPKFMGMVDAVVVLFMIAILMTTEWLGRNRDFAISGIYNSLSRPKRWALYCAIMLAVVWFSGNEQEFIYFRF